MVVLCCPDEAWEQQLVVQPCCSEGSTVEFGAFPLFVRWTCSLAANCGLHFNSAWILPSEVTMTASRSILRKTKIRASGQGGQCNINIDIEEWLTNHRLLWQLQTNPGDDWRTDWWLGKTGRGQLMAPHPKTPLTHAFSHKCFFKHVRMLHTNSEGSNVWEQWRKCFYFAVKLIFLL